MKKTTLLLILLHVAIFSVAQQRTEADAAAIAKAFMRNNGYDFDITKTTAPVKIRAKKAGEITPYYIFNDTRKGGFVIVGGQESMSDILAYSDEECFDINDMPPSAAGWLEVYSQCAILAADNPEKSKADKRAAEKSNFSLRQNVEPLLGEIKYNQGAPYNSKCPTMTMMDGGSLKKGKALTGCTQTAQAMIMRYWKWPQRPKGYKSYTFNYYYSYDQINQMTLSLDYDDEAVYEWDKMLPRYEGHDYTNEQVEAIANLMYHCGISNEAEYGLGITNAAISHQGMVEYFSYADDIVIDSYTFYRDKDNGDNEFCASLINEITQGRPILAGGWSADFTGGHYYVIDGYDLNSMLHFNLGWNGASNGYYEVTPVPQVPYGYNMYVCRHIHPEGRLTPTSPVRRVVVEAALGGMNEQTSNITNALNSLNSQDKYAESLIYITTADTEYEADNHLEGLAEIQGVLIDRHDTVTGIISATAVKTVYNERYNTDAPATIDIDAMFSSEKSMKVSVASYFANDINDADFRYIFVYTENDVLINRKRYNYIARGTYPNNSGYENSLPTKVEKDKEYIFEQEIPLPDSINNIDNATLIVMMIDANSGAIVNANTVALKQINEWREKQKPSFFSGGKLLATGTTLETYSFDEKNKRMYAPIKLNNPLYEPMEVEITASALTIGENAELQLGDTAGQRVVTYNLAPLTVDSTMMLYLNIDDEFKSSTSAIKLSVKYKDSFVAGQTVIFNFIESASGLNSFTVRATGTLEELVPKDAIDTISTITIGGRLCGKDIAFIRNNLKAKVIDLSAATIIEGPGVYYDKYVTENNVVGPRMFCEINASKVVLPKTTKKIDLYSFLNCINLTNVVIGKEVTSIGSYAFSGCTSLERITLPASVTEIGRNSFKKCPFVCVICEGETPAKVNSNTFEGADLANATLVVPNETAVGAYKAAKVWCDFGNIITYEHYLTDVKPITKETAVEVADGKIIVTGDAEAVIYTLTGRLVATGVSGEYALPSSNYVIKVGDKTIKIRIQ